MRITRTLRVVGCTVATGALLLTSAPMASADQVRDDQWPLQAFKAEEIWDVATGKGVTVAVIDDGVLSQHQDLRNNVLPGKDFIDGDASAEPEDGDDHGTAMASVIAAHGHGPGGADGVKGLAPDARILPIRDLGLTPDAFAGSIRYAVDQGASVINISLGGTPGQGTAELEAIKYALDKGVVIVAASGNDNDGPEVENFPAQHPGVVAVGAVKKTGEIWEDSSYGPHLMLTAPGERVVNASGDGPTGYRMGTGTSDSTAYVSAAVALLKEKFPDLTPGQLVNRLVKTAGLPKAAEGLSLPDQKYGYGYIQPLAALTRDIPPGPENGQLKVPDVAAPDGSSAPPDNNAPSDQSSAEESDSDDGGSLLPLVLGVVAALVVVVVVVIVLVRRKGRNGPPPSAGGGAGGWGGPVGAAGPPPQRPGPPQQPPASPGSYPPPPPPGQADGR